MSYSSDNNKRIAKNTMFLYFRMLLLMLVSLYTSRVVLDCLGVVDYGVYNVVGGMITMFSFLNTALAQATQRYIVFGLGHDTIEQQKRTFSMLINIHGIIALLIFLLCESVGVWLLYNKLVIPIERIETAFWVMQCSILMMVLNVLRVPYNASIFGYEKMDIYAYIAILEGLLKLGVVFVLEYAYVDKLLLYSIFLLLVHLLIMAISCFYCIRNFNNCHYVFYWSKGEYRSIFSYTSWGLLGDLAFTLNTQGMNLLINIFFGPVYNAARGIAVAVESAVVSFHSNFVSPAIPPMIKSFAKGDVEETLRLNIKTSKLGFLLFMCISLPLISVLNQILEIWLVTPPPQASLLCLLSLLWVQCRSLGGTLQNVIQATGDIKLFQLSYGGLNLLAMPCVYLLYRFHFPVSAYLWMLIFFSFVGLFVRIFVVNHQLTQFSVRKYLGTVVKPAIMAYILPFSIAIWMWNLSLGVITSLYVCLMTACLTLFSAWTIGLTSKEQSWILGLVQNSIRKFSV